jgi:polysaccharide biosynthesis transport protein
MRRDRRGLPQPPPDRSTLEIAMPSESTNTPLALPSTPSASPSDSHANLVLPALVNSPADAGPQLPLALTSAPTMSGLLQALRRRWILALALAVLATAGAVVAVFMIMPAKYPAQVRIHIAARGDVHVFGESNDEPEFLLYKANIAALVKSQSVLAAALNQKTSTGQDVKDLGIIRDNGIDWLESALKTDFVVGPEILKVTLSTDRPDEGAELLNAIAKSCVEENYLRDNERRDKRVKDFKDNLGKLEAELNKLRTRLRAQEKVLQVPDEKVRTAQYNALAQQQLKAGEAVTFNRTEQIKTGEELRSAQARLTKIDQMEILPEKVDEAFRKDDRSLEILLEGKNIDKEIAQTKANGQEPFIGPQLLSLEQKKQTITTRLNALKNQLRPEYEKIWRIKYADEMRDKILVLQDHLTTLEKQEPILKAELKATEDAAKVLAPSSQLPLEIVNLQSKVTTMEASVADVGRIIQKMVAEVVNPRVTILQLAAEPKNKDYSRQTKLAGAGGLGMFMLVLFGVAFLEFRSRRISGVDEVSQGLGLNIVGSLPPMPLSARRPNLTGAAPENSLWHNQVNEAVDAIRTMLLHSSRSESLRVIMITSASGGEGKTSLATQLAASLARAWRKTLLIDGDLRKPAAHKIFDIAQDPGFSELLRNEVSVTDAIKPTSLGRLWLMPAGHFDSHALQALAQDNMRIVFEGLKQQYDFIIVDACPVLPVADALVLGQHVDGVIFTILRDVSRVPAVYAAQQKMNNLGIRMLGAVMIGAKGELGSSGYAYARSK